MNIYIDESGDLGFSPRSTRYFVAAFLITQNPEPTRTAIRKLTKRLHRRKQYTGSELKFSNSSHATRISALNEMLQLQWTTGLIVLEKRKVSQRLRDKPNILYNYCIVNNVVKKILLLMSPDEDIKIHIDRSLSKTNRNDFNLYVKNKASWVWEVELERQPSLKQNQIQVAHENSHSDPCIQLADYIAGSTFQKYERNRPEYYALIEPRVESFTYLW